MDRKPRYAIFNVGDCEFCSNSLIDIDSDIGICELTQKEINDDRTFPKWCPLPKDPDKKIPHKWMPLPNPPKTT